MLGHARAAREAVTYYLTARDGGPTGYEAAIAEIRAEVGLTVADVPAVDPECIESGVYRGARARRWPHVAVVWEETLPSEPEEYRMARSRVAVYVAVPDSRITGDGANAGRAAEVYADALARMLDRGRGAEDRVYPGAALGGAPGVVEARLVSVIAGSDPAIAAGENVTLKATLEIVTAQEG